MTQLLPIVIGALFWAWVTEASTRGKYGVHPQSSVNHIPYFLLILTLALPIALRTRYNDTYAYIRNFYTADTLNELFTSGSLHLLRNPLFVIYSSIIRSFTDNQIIFFLFPAFFVQYSYVRFIRRHCPQFTFGIALYLFLGTYTFSIAAMKQVLAMAILLYAVDFLMEQKRKKFYLMVFIAFLFHTYALVFLLLPFFTAKPWSVRSFVFLIGIFFFMGNFETVITSFLDVANSSGKSVSSSEILGTASINPLRVAVYAVTPFCALVFRRYLFNSRWDREHNLLVNMSFICVAIMSIGLVSAANMFARMGQYFEFGVICSLPWIISKPFERMSSYLVNLIALFCFVLYFIYTNVFWMPFDDSYSRYTLMEALESLLQSLAFG